MRIATTSRSAEVLLDGRSSVLYVIVRMIVLSDMLA